MRKTRSQISTGNRRGLLDAARAQFIAKGFHGASVDAIAAAAGFSKGAVYSQFGGKDELFLALLETRIEHRHQTSTELARDLAGTEGVAALARQAVGASADDVAWQALLLEFRAHAARHPATNARYAELHRRTIESVASLVAGVFERGAVTPPVAPETLAVVFLALGSGLCAEVLVDSTLDIRDIAARVARTIASEREGGESTP